MLYIVLILILFALSVAVHLFYCRKTDKPGLHAKMFIITAVVFLCIDGFVSLAIRHSGMVDPGSLGGMPLIITGGLVFILLVPIYLCFYVLTQLKSPSKVILSVIARQGEMTYAGILACIEKENFIATRLEDLLASGCVRFVEGRYVLTPEGEKIAFILDGMQLILGRRAGG